MAMDSTNTTDKVPERQKQSDNVHQDINFSSFEQARQQSMNGSNASNFLPSMEITSSDIQATAKQDGTATVSDLFKSGFQAAGEDWNNSIRNFDASDPSAHDRNQYNQSYGRDVATNLENTFSGNSQTSASDGGGNAAGNGTGSIKETDKPISDYEVTGGVIRQAAHQDAHQLVLDLTQNGFGAASQDYQKDIKSFANVDPSQWDRNKYSSDLTRDISKDLALALGGSSDSGTGTAYGGGSGSGDSGAGNTGSGSGSGESGVGNSGSGGGSGSGDSGAGNSGSGSGSGSGESGVGNSGSGSGSGSGFSISDGKLLVNGAALNGVAVDSRYAQQIGPQAIANQIASEFPGINVVRFATSPDGGIFTNGKPYAAGTYDGADNESVADVNAMIQAFNAKGIAVIIDNHGSDAGTANNVSQDGNEAAWFGQLAKDNLGNNMVMFQTQNEPTSTDWHGTQNTAADLAVANEQQAVYNAIRATGSNAIVAFEQEHGVANQGAPFQDAASTYDSDYNYVIDAHLYGSTSDMQAVLNESQNLHEANGGAVPVYFGETGNSGDGANLDSGASSVLQTLYASGDGAIAWEYNPLHGASDVDNLANADGTLNSYGEEIAALIKANADSSAGTANGGGSGSGESGVGNSGSGSGSGSGESGVGNSGSGGGSGSGSGESGVGNSGSGGGSGSGSGESGVGNTGSGGGSGSGSGESGVGNTGSGGGSGSGESGVNGSNPGQGLFIDGVNSGMQTVFNMNGATDLGAFADQAGIVASNGFNPSNGPGGVARALVTQDNGTFDVTVANPWNENGHTGSYTEQIPIPDGGLAALEAAAKQTNSDGHVLIEDTLNHTYYDLWLAQNIGSGNNSGTAETLVQGALNGNGTPGSTAAGVTEAYADTSVSSGLHPLLFDLPTNMMHPGNGGMVQGSTNSDVTSGSTGVQEGDIVTLSQEQANQIFANNPNLNQQQKMIIEDAVPVDQGGGGGWIIADQAGTGWSGDENFSIWQMQQNSVDLSYLSHLQGPDPNAVLDQLQVWTNPNK